MSNQYGVWLTKWPIIYVMAGICVVGLLCKGIAAIGYLKMCTQIKRLAKGKEISGHKLTRQLIDNYRRHLQEGKDIKELDNYVEEAVTGARFFGMSLVPLENINLAMMVASFTLGAVGSLVAFINGATDSEVIFLFTAGLSFTGIGVVAEVLSRNDYYRTLYYLGMQNYLANEVKSEFLIHKESEEAIKEARQERKNKVFSKSMEAKSLVNKVPKDVAAARIDNTLSNGVEEEALKEVAATREPARPQIDNEVLEEMLRSLLLGK